jgi:non-homologous end joining protein Ku
MTYKEESYVLDTLKELQDTIRSPAFKQAIKEIHENNIMLKQIVKMINTHNARHHQENEDDFMRNVLANLISSGFDISKLVKR